VWLRVLRLGESSPSCDKSDATGFSGDAAMALDAEDPTTILTGLLKSSEAEH